MTDEVLRTGPHNTMRVLEHTDETLLFEAVWGAGNVTPPPHLHPTQEEHFELAEGELQVILEGEGRTLAAGEQLVVPAGAVHQMWNIGPEDAKGTWRITPPQQTLEFFRTLASGDIPPDFLERFSGEFQLAR